MRLLFLIISCIILSSEGTSVGEQWKSFKRQYSKKYNAKEEEKRFSIFQSNLKIIEEHNRMHASGKVSFSLKINRFGDMLPEEMGGNMKILNKTNGFLGAKHFPSVKYAVPEEIDWRKKGAVTPVKNQGECEGCWAFSATGALEGQLFRATGELVSLSEQQLIDCSSENLGCSGGLMDRAFEYLESVGGIASENNYPYEGTDRKCRYTPEMAVPGTEVKSYKDLPEGDEEALKMAVANIGPISVAVTSKSSHFMFYEKGIFSGEFCNKTKVDHGILLVGYGSENGQDFWIAKNSWSTLWGEEGYMRLARNQNNACNVATLASYPTFSSNDEFTLKPTPEQPTTSNSYPSTDYHEALTSTPKASGASHTAMFSYSLFSTVFFIPNFFYLFSRI